MYLSKISGLLVVPPIAVLLAKSPLVDKYQLTSMKELVVGAAPLGRDTEDQLIAKISGLTNPARFGFSIETFILTVFI